MLYILCFLLIVLWIAGGAIVQMLYAMHYSTGPNTIWYKVATAGVNATLAVIKWWSK